MPQYRQPVANAALSEVIERSGWSMSDIADLINQVAAENGVQISYDGASIARWLNGAQPRKRRIPFVVAALARAARQPNLTPKNLGWGNVMYPGLPTSWHDDPVTCLSQLVSEDLNHPGDGFTDLYAADALALVNRPLPAGELCATRDAASCDMEHIWTMAFFFHELAAARGGGRGRSALSAYLLHDVIPHLRTVGGPTRPKLLQAASVLVRILGWMSLDAGAEGRAQKYYVQALRLAEESGASATRATVLSLLWGQAARRGHDQIALAGAGLDAARQGCHARVRAQAKMVQACRLGVVGDRRGALRALKTAEREMERTGTRTELPWYEDFRYDAFTYGVGMILMSFGDLNGAESYFAHALTTHHVGHDCVRALITAGQARVHIAQGRLGDAGDALRRLTGDTDRVVSFQLQREVTAMRKVLDIESGTASVNDFARSTPPPQLV